MRTVLLLTLLAAALLAARAPAEAMVESCPAHLSVLEPAASTPSASLYTYTLGALSQRTLDATMIADTDRGWFAWSVSGLPLERVERMDSAGTWPIRYQAWATPEQAVALPAGTTVRRAWVTAARAVHEVTFNWDAKGTVACDVPAFETPPSPAPAPAAPVVVPGEAPVVAAPAPAPFDPPACAVPFVAPAIVSGPPLNAAALGGANEGLAAEAAVIDVAIDGAGSILDAWIEGSTHSAFDRLAMGGALHSTYRGAVSYCRPAEAIVKYTAWYQPTQ